MRGAARRRGSGRCAWRALWRARRENEPGARGVRGAARAVAEWCVRVKRAFASGECGESARRGGVRAPRARRALCAARASVHPSACAEARRRAADMALAYCATARTTAAAMRDMLCATPLRTPYVRVQMSTTRQTLRNGKEQDIKSAKLYI